MRWTALLAAPSCLPFSFILRGRLKGERAAPFSYLLSLSFSFALLLLPVEAKPVTFDDGLVHIIDANNSFPFESVIVQDGPGSTNTTVNLVSGGLIGGGLTAIDGSQIEMSGGRIEFSLRALDRAHISITGGVVANNLETSNDVTAEISGGTVGGEFAIGVSPGSAAVEITGGQFGGALTCLGSSVVDIREGEFAARVGSFENSLLTIYGGVFRGALEARESSTLNVWGGTFESGFLLSVDAATLTIFGSGFNFPLGDITAFSGTLTGVLANGTPINNEFGRSSGARIILAAVTDSDSDGVADGIDNCLNVPNPAQVDTDGNGVGDACNNSEDADGDEYADNLDNCPDDPNPGQEDRDFDGIGDACDPFPDDPANEFAQCEADLEQCLMQGFPDADTDGIPDSVDSCGATPQGEEVDDSGCSHEEFCNSVDATLKRGGKTCKLSDWKNDEPVMKRADRDCIVDKGERGREDDQCVPR